MTWGLIVEENEGFGRERRVWTSHVLEHVQGTREEAMDALRERARHYAPVHPSSPRHRMLYEHTDGFLLVIEGVTQTFHCRFTLARLIGDSASQEKPEARSRPSAEPLFRRPHA